MTPETQTIRRWLGLIALALGVALIVVDTTIVDPRHFDFYMASHGGLKGTSRPVHYDVICDENNFGMEAIESLCFRLCFQDARSTKAVSQIPLIRAADMVAEREKYRMAGKMLVGSNHDTGSHEDLQTSGKAMYFV